MSCSCEGVRFFVQKQLALTGLGYDEWSPAFLATNPFTSASQNSDCSQFCNKTASMNHFQLVK